MSPPKGIMNLLETRITALDQPAFDNQMFAPHCPAFVENGVAGKPPQFAGVPVLNGELKMVARIGFVSAGELETKMLANFGKLLFWSGNAEAQIIDPKDSLLLLGERGRRTVGSGGKMVPKEGRGRQNLQRFAPRERGNSEFSEPALDRRGSPSILLEERT